MPRISSTAGALLLGAGIASAQAAERSTFYVVSNNDTIAVERVERSATRLRAQILVPSARARTDVDAQLGQNGLVTSFGMKIFVPDQDTTPRIAVDARFSGDSVGVTHKGATNWIRVGENTLPNTNPSAALLEQLLIRAKALGGDSANLKAMYLPDGPASPVTVTWIGTDSALLRFPNVTIRAGVSSQGRLMGAIVPTQGLRFVRGPEIVASLRTTSYDAPRGAPYSSQDVSIRTEAGLTLRGTLTLPQRATGARVPAIVTITGTGTQDRDEAIPGLKGYRPYYQLADTLGRRGIAVLRLDDRGGGSDGPAGAPTPELADDIRAAVAWLRARPEIDATRIGLVGHSEGGTIGPMVAATDSGIAAVVVLAGTVSRGRDIVAFQQRFVVDSMARLKGQAREAALAQYARNTDSLAKAVPWWTFFLDYDGTATAARVRAPVLVLHGEKDYQVPVAEAEKLAAAVRSGGNRDVTVRVFPGANHLFLPDEGAGFSYEKLKSYTVPPAVMGAIAEWLVARLIR